jgi:hypothetical protein
MTGRDISTGGRPVSRYDLILAAIPLAFVTAILAAVVLGVPLRSTMGAASLVGALAVGDAIFRNPPTNSGGIGR